MKFQRNNFYHVFNRGNNKQKIFLRKENYFYFIKKIKELICPNCSVVSYCLMPNHFHLLLYIANEQDQTLASGKMQVLERKLGTLQSSYTRAINIQESKTGSLFQSKCKVLELDESHTFACFHYIHQNPVKAGLCSSFEGWNFSSYGEYSKRVDNNICNLDIAYEFLQVPRIAGEFIEQSRKVVIDQEVLLRLE
jgi:putative transposase